MSTPKHIENIHKAADFAKWMRQIREEEPLVYYNAVLNEILKEIRLEGMTVRTQKYWLLKIAGRPALKQLGEELS